MNSEAVVTLREALVATGVMTAFNFYSTDYCRNSPQPNRTQPNMNSICLIMN